MNCDKCETRLLDLLYGELGDEDATQVRDHVQTCASCQTSYARLGTARKLAVHMRREEPRAELDREILARARVRAAELAKASAVTHGAGDGIWRGIVRFLGGFAMGPQVAMATLLMLMVTIGIYYLPRLRQVPELASGAVVNPDPAGEAGPSGAIEPAPSLELDIDPRTGRIRARNGEPLTRRAEARREPVAALTPTPGATPMPQGDLEAPSLGTDRAGGVVTGALDEGSSAGEIALGDGERLAQDSDSLADAPAEEAQQQQPRQQLAFGGTEAERRSSARARTAPAAVAGGRGGAPSGMAESADVALARADDTRQGAPALRNAPTTGTTTVLAEAPAQRTSPERAMMAQSATAPAAPPPAHYAVQQAPPTAPVQPSTTFRVSAAEQSSMAGASAGASMSPTPGPSGARPAEPPADVGRGVEGRDLTPGALHAQARNFRSSGTLAQAAARYETLLSRYPTYAGAGDALMELADCYRRLGRLGQARTVLERASRNRNTQIAQRARFEIMRINQAERAPARTPASAADEAVPSSASGH